MNPLEPYLPYIRYALVAIIPALLVFTVEQSNIASLKTQLAAAEEEANKPPPAPPVPVHLFTAKDVTDVTALQREAGNLTQNIDHYRAANINEMACMQGIRNSVTSFVEDRIAQLREEMVVSVSGDDQKDIAYADRQMQGTVSSILKYVPALKGTLQQMMQSCPGNQQVGYQDNVISRFLDYRLSPFMKAVQGRIEKAQAPAPAKGKAAAR